jgi:hypothetical protein
MNVPATSSLKYYATTHVPSIYSNSRNPPATTLASKNMLSYDERALRDTIRMVEEVDADTDVLTILAHDWSLKSLLGEFPANLNAWKEKGWKDQSRWMFLADLGGVVGKEMR